MGSHAPFARSLGTLQRFARLTAGDPQPQLTVPEMYELAADGIGTDFMTKAIHRTIARTSEPFANFWPEFAVADAIQTRRGVDSQARNRLWELLAGALVASFATDVFALRSQIFGAPFLGVGGASPASPSTRRIATGRSTRSWRARSNSKAPRSIAESSP